MFCRSCGQQVPDKVTFCPKCGKMQSQSSSAEEPSRAPELWETCEIELDKKSAVMGLATYIFLARGISQRRQYPVGRSPEITLGSPFFRTPKSDDKPANKAHQALVDQLMEDGWQPLPEAGQNWWSYRFRRKIDPYWDECEVQFRVQNYRLGSADAVFIAEARRSPDGGYDGEVSPFIVFRGLDRIDKDQAKTTPHVMDAFLRFREQLFQAGWEPIASGGKFWWNQRFRRSARRKSV